MLFKYLSKCYLNRVPMSFNLNLKTTLSAPPTIMRPNNTNYCLALHNISAIFGQNNFQKTM